jgi:hypothetical protein
MRRVYVIDPAQSGPTANDITAAAAVSATEIARGLPPVLVKYLSGPQPAYPFFVDEPDHPLPAPMLQAIAVLRNTFRTTRTPTQIDNCIDALTVLVRELYSQAR